MAKSTKFVNDVEVTGQLLVNGSHVAISGQGGSSVDLSAVTESIIPSVSGANLGSESDPWNTVYASQVLVKGEDVNSEYDLQSNEILFWETYNQPNGISDNLSAVAYGDGKFVGIEFSGDVSVVSTDGETWTRYATMTSGVRWGITYGNGLFVVVGHNGYVATSPDGQNWTNRTGQSGSWYDVIYNDGLFVAVGGYYGVHSRVMTSTNGIDWVARTAGDDTDFWRSVTYGKGLYVAVGLATSSYGSAEVVMTSPNGIDWTTRSAPGISWLSVTYGKGIFVAVGYDSYLEDYRIMNSANGIDWESGTGGVYNGDWAAVSYGNGLFVVGGSNEVATSKNGIDWVVNEHNYKGDAFGNIKGLTYGNGRFVAVGESGRFARALSNDTVIPKDIKVLGDRIEKLHTPSLASFTQTELNNYFGIQYTPNGEVFTAHISYGGNEYLVTHSNYSWKYVQLTNVPS
jgi:hypothetical protein